MVPNGSKSNTRSGEFFRPRARLADDIETAMEPTYTLWDDKDDLLVNVWMYTNVHLYTQKSSAHIDRRVVSQYSWDKRQACGSKNIERYRLHRMTPKTGSEESLANGQMQGGGPCRAFILCLFVVFL
jgi:hypothetical protein